MLGYFPLFLFGGVALTFQHYLTNKTMASQKIVITGGLGFLGHNLCRALLQRAGTGPIQIKLVDTQSAVNANPSFSVFASNEQRLAAANASQEVEVLAGDIGDASFCNELIGSDTSSIFHLAAAMSGECETNPDLCVRTNVTGTMNLLDAVRLSRTTTSSSDVPPPRFVFASTGAVFGSTTGGVSDKTKLLPETTYGTSKSMW
jgi:nucleoside-diphosphate-sugar epimerase